MNDVIVNNLIGEAIVSLINAGSSSAIVGAFAMDYPAKVGRVFQEHCKKEVSTMELPNPARGPGVLEET